MTNDVELSATIEAAQILRQPYARIILPETDGTFRGEIMEFPGCIASGETASETLIALEDVARSWILAALARKQNIPEPIDISNDFSGRLVLRIPKSLHKKSSWIAEREGVSLNHFITMSLSETVGERNRSVMSVFISPSAPTRYSVGGVSAFGTYDVVPIGTATNATMPGGKALAWQLASGAVPCYGCATMILEPASAAPITYTNHEAAINRR
jgi:antitoxin HicB